MENKKGKITGLGGVFFKCKDPQAMRDWYNENFGLSNDKYGHPFVWKKQEASFGEKNFYAERLSPQTTDAAGSDGYSGCG